MAMVDRTRRSRRFGNRHPPRRVRERHYTVVVIIIGGGKFSENISACVSREFVLRDEEFDVLARLGDDVGDEGGGVGHSWLLLTWSCGGVCFQKSAGGGRRARVEGGGREERETSERRAERHTDLGPHRSLRLVSQLTCLLILPARRLHSNQSNSEFRRVSSLELRLLHSLLMITSS